MAIKFSVEGENNKVKKLINTIKSVHQWRLYNESKFSVGGNETHVDGYLDENPYMKLVPTAEEVSQLIITSNGKKIKIPLLNAKVIDIGNGFTYIHGSNYDIFAAPTNTEMKEV